MLNHPTWQVDQRKANGLHSSGTPVLSQRQSFHDGIEENLLAVTTISSSRNVVRIDDVQKFRIVTICTAAGDLPDAGIFVQQIMDSDDPAEDEFDRVSEIVDLEDYLNDRTAAVAAGDDYWRSNLLVKFYTDNGINERMPVIEE